MSNFTLIKPTNVETYKTERFEHILWRSLIDYSYDTITTADEFECADLKGKKVLFAVPLGESGVNLECIKILKKIRLNRECLDGCIGASIVDGTNEIYTKAVARELAFGANISGCTFIGKSLVEGTGTLKNYNTIARNISADNLEAYAKTAEHLIHNLMTFEKPKKNNPKILAIHAGHSEKSNTKALWDMVRTYLPNIDVTEISLQDGEVKDCRGCAYATCLDFGKQKSCFYSDWITEKIYPALIDCDVLVLISPNYNDAPTAYIAAFMNRLTALLRGNHLVNKQLFAVIVSGYSGGDLVAKQIISTLNMNRPFILPSRFALLETANNPGEVKEIPEIEKIAHEFAENILKQIKL